MKWKLIALSVALAGLATIFLIIYRQNVEIASVKAQNSAHLASIHALSMQQKVTESAISTMDKGKTAAVKDLMNDRQQIAEEVRHDATVANWHDTSLPDGLIRLLTSDPDSDNTHDSTSHPHGSN